MSAAQGFLLGLGVTVVLLVGVIATGVRARRRLHLPLVAAFFVALGITIVFAERMGRSLDLAAAGRITPIHLALAKTTTVLYLLPVATGALTLRDPRWRPRHRVLAWLLVLLTLTTVGTGAWMTLASEPL